MANVSLSLANKTTMTTASAGLNLSQLVLKHEQLIKLYLLSRLIREKSDEFASLQDALLIRLASLLLNKNEEDEEKHLEEDSAHIIKELLDYAIDEYRRQSGNNEFKLALHNESRGNNQPRRDLSTLLNEFDERSRRFSFKKVSHILK
jgi:hypothetical protein